MFSASESNEMDPQNVKEDNWSPGVWGIGKLSRNNLRKFVNCDSLSFRNFKDDACIEEIMIEHDDIDFDVTINLSDKMIQMKDILILMFNFLTKQDVINKKLSQPIHEYFENIFRNENNKDRFGVFDKEQFIQFILVLQMFLDLEEEVVKRIFTNLQYTLSENLGSVTANNLNNQVNKFLLSKANKTKNPRLCVSAILILTRIYKKENNLDALFNLYHSINTDHPYYKESCHELYHIASNILGGIEAGDIHLSEEEKNELVNIKDTAAINMDGIHDSQLLTDNIIRQRMGLKLFDRPHITEVKASAKTILAFTDETRHFIDENEALKRANLALLEENEKLKLIIQQQAKQLKKFAQKQTQHRYNNSM